MSAVNAMTPQVSVSLSGAQAGALHPLPRGMSTRIRGRGAPGRWVRQLPWVVVPSVVVASAVGATVASAAGSVAVSAEGVASGAGASARGQSHQARPAMMTRAMTDWIVRFDDCANVASVG